MNIGKLPIVVSLLLAAALDRSFAVAQAVSPSPKGGPLTVWQSDSVVHIAGLENIKPQSAGSLSLTSELLTFSTKESLADISVNFITKVSIGQQRVATGGTGAKIVRMIPIFGIGTVAGATTNRSVGLLTIEFRDSQGGHHGAVFEVPKTQAVIAQERLLPLVKPEPVEESKSCDGPTVPHSMLVAPIVSLGIDLPAEYRVLLYEQMVDQLKSAGNPLLIYRVGDVEAPCAATHLQLSVTAFKKGNEAIRESTGPVGLFAGVTSVKFKVDLSDNRGTQLFEKALKQSKHGDADSLSVTRDLAKTVSKHLAKANQISPRNAS